MLKDILNSVMRYEEMTFSSSDSEYCMNKYRLSAKIIHVNKYYARLLIDSGVVEAGSANWETGEQHYILSCRYFNRIDKINFILMCLYANNILYKCDEVINEMLTIKIQQERKEKLKKIEKI